MDSTINISVIIEQQGGKIVKHSGHADYIFSTCPNQMDTRRFAYELLQKLQINLMIY